MTRAGASGTLSLMATGVDLEVAFNLDGRFEPLALAELEDNLLRLVCVLLFDVGIVCNLASPDCIFNNCTYGIYGRQIVLRLLQLNSYVFAET